LLNGRVKLGIWAPKNNGGTDIIGYEYTIDGGATWARVDASSTDRVMVISGLENGMHYVVKVRALNAAGPGAMSNARGVTPRGVASAPVITSLVSKSGKITVHYDVPVNNGGSAITRYAYSVDGVWHNFGATNYSKTIKGLKNGVSYSICIKALNSAGWGAVSNVMEATPHK